MTHERPRIRTGTPERRRGRPRIAEADAVVQIFHDLSDEGIEEATLSELANELAARIPCSRATGFRLLHQAHNEGKIRIPGF